jgi:head-tail adaptor
MGKCKTIRIDSRVKICTGDLRHTIILHTRDLTAPTASDFGVKLSNPLTVKAGLEITQGIEDIDSTNIRKVITHNFYIRFTTYALKSTLIEFDSKYFTVETVQALDGYNRYLKIESRERGTTTKEVNFI